MIDPHSLMNIDKIGEHLNKFDFDIRKLRDARWIDQKCAPDVVCIIADCVVNYVENSGEPEFTVNDIWDSPYFSQHVVELFSKPHPGEPTARSEYDKFIQQPLRMLGYAQVLSCVKHGTTNRYSVKNREILEFIARKDVNAYKFLYEYICKVLSDSGFLQRFDDYRQAYLSGNSPKQAFHELKSAFRDFVFRYTPITGETEVYRIFPKVLNPYAVANKIAGAKRGFMSKSLTSFSDLPYNQVNWRDVGKEKHLTRQEYDEVAALPKAMVVTRYLIQKAKSQISRKYEQSEVQDEYAASDSFQVHHIFPENEFPHLAAYLENLINLSPTQHYSRAHPKNNTHVISRDFQLICLLAKSGNIKKSLELGEELYDKGNFVFVVNEGVRLKLVENSLDFGLIEAAIVHHYNSTFLKSAH